jgi:Domain of unknown function (DUF5655)/Domain of unknown function (DUF4287)
MPAQSTRSLYSVHPSVSYARSILAGLPAKTGKSIDEWVDIVQTDGPPETKARKEWLKKAHKLGGTTASMIVEHAEGRGHEDTDPDAYLAAAPLYVDKMYSGPKAALRPLHDALIAGALQRREAVKVCPCQTIVPLYHNHVIAQIKPTTNKRIDFGLALKGATKRLPSRLIATGGLQKGDRITHRIPLTSVDEIDGDLWTWFELACDLDA